MTLSNQQTDWEDLSALDPYWAILSRPEGRHGNWDIEEFFLTGEKEIRAAIEIGSQLGHPNNHGVALDFGCGVGRLTRTLSQHFERCYGVDISENMIDQARQLNHKITNCKFVVNDKDNLTIFDDNYFDLIYTNIVLQHIPDKSTIKAYISEFVRTLSEGGLLVFQLPCQIPLKNRLQPRRRAYAILKTLGIHRKILYEKLGLYPIRMNFVPENEVIELLETQGAKVLDVKPSSTAGSTFVSNNYYVTKQAI
jgi:ubiquinone/menaquinone biosynthesis C-methylase UbiE